MSSTKKLKLGILISGAGSNMIAIHDAIESGELNAEIVLVLSNKPDAKGLEKAHKLNIPALAIDPKNYKRGQDGSVAYNRALLYELHRHKVDLVVMAGYMKLLGSEVLIAYPHKVLNIHPSLLPSFPGAQAIQDALDAGVKCTGVTVHFANEEFDEGPIIAQESLKVLDDDSFDSLSARIHSIEHKLYPQVIEMICKDRLDIEGKKVTIRPER